jgi:hypothetical protein
MIASLCLISSRRPADTPIPITVTGGSLTGNAGGGTFSKIANVTGFMVSLAILYYLFTAMFKGTVAATSLFNRFPCSR